MFQGGYINGADRALMLMEDIIEGVTTGKSDRNALVNEISKSGIIIPSPASPSAPLKVFLFCELFIGGYSTGDEEDGFEHCDGTNGEWIQRSAKFSQPFNFLVFFSLKTPLGRSQSMFWEIDLYDGRRVNAPVSKSMISPL